MVLAWRVVSALHAEDPFGGEGAARHAGRWNKRGTPVVYTASSKALAILEVLPYFRPHTELAPFLAYPVRFASSLIEKVGELPPGWKAPRVPRSTQDIGTCWAQEYRSVVLAVPSVRVEEEFNYILNPRHPDFGRLRIGKPTVVSLLAFLPRDLIPRTT